MRSSQCPDAGGTVPRAKGCTAGADKMHLVVGLWSRHPWQLRRCTPEGCVIRCKPEGCVCAAKHGGLGLVRTAALEGGAHGLTVNTVAPGWMDSRP
ncbi:SDR family oxidoreductase [Bradyrhizobium sp. CW9]|nr:SDR family oxidoreductase [Bradyrhizobium sp. CW9]